jgi:hypothetical protein
MVIKIVSNIRFNNISCRYDLEYCNLSNLAYLMNTSGFALLEYSKMKKMPVSLYLGLKISLFARSTNFKNLLIL